MKSVKIACSVLIAALSFQGRVSAQQFSLVKDILSGTTGTFPAPPAGTMTIIFNGTVYFIVDDGIHGRELWKSDGTPTGTTMVKDINPGVTGSNISSIVAANDVLYFSANDLTHGQELWKSDGTEGGTQMITDIYPGTTSGCTGGTRQMGSIGNMVYFAAKDPDHGIELWKSDGTEAGTVMVRDIQPGKYTTGIQAGTYRNSAPQTFTAGNGIMFFNASDDLGGTGSELWKTDGTEAGTVMVKDIQPGTGGSIVRDCIFLNGKLYFNAWFWDRYNLWTSDGTDAGTYLLEDGVNDFSLNFWTTEFNGELFFADWEGLWKTDGTQAGTVLVKALAVQNSPPSHLVNVLGTLYFVGYDAAHGYELWKSDGTTAGTQLVKDINPGSNNSDYLVLAKAGNKLMFSVSHPVYGYELWTSDGTEAGTQLFQEIEPGSLSAPASTILETNGKFFAIINTAAYGTELWSTNALLSSPLPLTLLEFKGTLVNNDGFLQWKTDNELNTSSFIVERSIDGRHYSAIGSIGAANSQGIHYYNYTDVNVKSIGAPVIYYRLKKTDIDNKFTYSRIVALAIDNDKNLVMVYPNPVKNELNLTITLARRERVNWQLTDMNGRVIKLGSYDLSAGSTAVSVDVTDSKPGSYLMRITGSTINEVTKVIKQ